MGFYKYLISSVFATHPALKPSFYSLISRTFQLGLSKRNDKSNSTVHVYIVD